MSTTPFSWQDKRVLRLIRESCPDYHSALAVYVALSVVASDKENAEFQTTHQWLATLSGLSSRTVGSRLDDLTKIGAVAVTAPVGPRQPNTYRLSPLSNDCRTFGNGCRTFGNAVGPPLQTSEEKKKRREYQKPKGTAERIGMEGQQRILKARLAELEADTAEQWQRDASPRLVTEKQNVRAELKALENSLLEI